MKKCSCFYGVNTNQPFVHGRPCKGVRVLCSHPKQKLPYVGAAGCNPEGCRWFTLGWDVPAAAPASAPVTVLLPVRNEKDVYRTVESYLNAGAAEVIVVDDASRDPVVSKRSRCRVVRNKRPRGPAWCRNEGVRLATQSTVCWSDGHVRFLGDLAEFAEEARKREVVLCATCLSMESGRLIGWGGAWQKPSAFSPFPRVVWNTKKPKERFTEIPALDGSVYCCTKETFEKFGGWPETLSHGYNEASISLACLFAGVPMVVDTKTEITHLFRKSMPYSLSGEDQILNRIISNSALWEDPGYLLDLAKCRKEYRTALARARTRHKHTESVRKKFRALSVRTDESVARVVGIRTRRKVAWALALAPGEFPMWRTTAWEVLPLVDSVYIRLDKNNMGDTTTADVRAFFGSKLRRLEETEADFSFWRWREDAVRMMDRDRPDVVIALDQDETFSPGFEEELEEFVQSGKGGMMFSFRMKTKDGRRVRLYPTSPHMKVFRWKKGLSFKGYKGCGVVPAYAHRRDQKKSRTKVEHWCSYTPEMEKAKWFKYGAWWNGIDGRKRPGRAHSGIFFYHVPKTAGGAVEAVFKRRKDFQRLEHKLCREEYGSFRFCIVRNPYDRLVSAWTYLREKQDPEHFKVLREEYRAQILQYSNFDEMVRDLPELSKVILHFIPQTTICDMNLIDYVGRFEKLKDELEYLAGVLSVPYEDPPVVRPSNHRPWPEYYEKEETRRTVTRVYSQDLLDLGYPVFA